MATVRQVITRSLRWITVTGTGRRVPAATEAADALVDIQAMYLDLINKGADLTDVLISAAYTANENERITKTGVYVVTNPTTILDQDTQATRAPHDFAVIIVAGATPETYVRDANLASWVRIEGLTLDSPAPWSSTLEQGLAALLALTIAEGYGKGVPPACAGLAGEARDRIISRMQASGQDLGSVFFQPDRVRV